MYHHDPLRLMVIPPPLFRGHCVSFLWSSSFGLQFRWGKLVSILGSVTLHLVPEKKGLQCGCLSRWTLKKSSAGRCVASSHFRGRCVKSFDTVDRGISDCASSRLDLPGWLRRTYFWYHAHVRLRSKLAAVTSIADAVFLFLLGLGHSARRNVSVMVEICVNA